MLDQGDAVVGGGGDVSAPTLVRLTASPAGVRAGEPLALAARVLTVHPADRAPSGTVAFRAARRLLGTAALDASGHARLEGVSLPCGLHTIVASYGGDAGHAAASSPPVPQAVLAPVVAVVVVVAEPMRTADGVVLEAELLHPERGRLLEEATGSLVFSSDGVVLGSAPLRDGQARVVVDGELPGELLVRYDGDAEHSAAIGSRGSR